MKLSESGKMKLDEGHGGAPSSWKWKQNYLEFEVSQGYSASES